jgi:hypothetical protein
VPAWLAGSPAALRHPAPRCWHGRRSVPAPGSPRVGAALAFAASGSRAAMAGLVAGVTLAAYLVTVTAWVTVRTLARRRSHRGLLDLVATPIAAVPGGRLLESGTPMAYVVPGLRPRTVLTSAVLAAARPGGRRRGARARAHPSGPSGTTW